MNATRNERPSRLFRRYCGKVRLLSAIHAEIAGELNARREAMFHLFFRPEDRYIAESTNPEELAKLILTGIIKGGGEIVPEPEPDA